MRVAQISKAGADFEIIEREIPKPGPGHVRIRVQACGVCHSDVLTKEGGWPGLAYPRAPGHEAKPAGIAVLTDSDDTNSSAQGDYANFRVCRQ